MNELTGTELHSILDGLACEFDAAGAPEVAARLRQALPFFVGSMHEFFGEARDALRDVSSLNTQRLSNTRREAIPETIERITAALRMDNLDRPKTPSSTQPKTLSSRPRKKMLMSNACAYGRDCSP